MSKISKPSECPGRERFLSLEEKKRLLDACRVSSNPNLFPMVAISLITALRYGELTGLRWSDISFEQRSILFVKQKMVIDELSLFLQKKLKSYFEAVHLLALQRKLGVFLKSLYS